MSLFISEDALNTSSVSLVPAVTYVNTAFVYLVPGDALDSSSLSLVPGDALKVASVSLGSRAVLHAV